RSFGKGRVVYFPWDIDRTFWEILSEDHLKLLRNSVEWATNESPAIEVTGPGLLDITAWRQPHAIIIHLVNLTNPMAMKGPYRDFFPIAEQQIKIRTGNGPSPKQARLLVAGSNAEMKRSASTLSLTVPSILDHEMVVVDL